MEWQVRAMREEDIGGFPQAFAQQGWNKPLSQFQQYYREQREGVRKVFVAASGGDLLGYATLLPQSLAGPFAGMGIPTVYDFNVLQRYQRQGVGTSILNAIEEEVGACSPRICLGVGLHWGYGQAQRMYVKRGYVPDGSGVWYRDKRLEQYAPCCNDDDLVLYLTKELRG